MLFSTSFPKFALRKKAKRPSPKGGTRQAGRGPAARRALCPCPPLPGDGLQLAERRAFRLAPSQAHTAMAVAADSHRLPPPPPAGSGPALRRASRHGTAFFLKLRLYSTPFRPARQV